MPRKFFRRYLPSYDAVMRYRYIGRLATWVHHPNLWHLNRDSVAGGLAIGLFAGLVPGPFQMLTAALLCVLFKVNLPVALATTLYTNPLTIGPLYLLAYEIGKLFFAANGATAAAAPALDWSHPLHWLHVFGLWMLSLGKPLAIGLIVLALGLAVLGYFAVQIIWRAQVLLAWRKRAHRRRQR